jgi:hypothetical protein
MTAIEAQAKFELKQAKAGTCNSASKRWLRSSTFVLKDIEGGRYQIGPPCRHC